MASSCNYGFALERMLRDQFIGGIKDNQIRQILLDRIDFESFQGCIVLAFSENQMKVFQRKRKAKKSRAFVVMANVGSLIQFVTAVINKAI